LHPAPPPDPEQFGIQRQISGADTFHTNTEMHPHRRLRFSPQVLHPECPFRILPIPDTAPVCDHSMANVQMTVLKKRLSFPIPLISLCPANPAIFIFQLNYR
jgi:hypothetical protein